MRKYIVIAVILLIGYLLACEKDIFENVFTTTTSQEQESSTTDETKSLAGATGLFYIVILGDGYKPNQESIYQQHAAAQIAALRNIPPFSERGDIRYTIIPLKDVKGNLGCDYSGTFADGTALVCDPTRVRKAIGNRPMDRVIILVAGKGHGGADGQIVINGLGDFTSSTFCTFNQAAFYGKGPHELGHTFLGPGHLLTVSNKMFTCTNGCCEVWNKDFTLEQQTVIHNYIDSVVIHKH